MRSPYVPVPVIGLAAISGTGKTTLLRQVITLLRARGLSVGLIKRAHHTFDIDKPGKDSYELRKAGASQVLVGSDRRWALMVENDRPAEPELDDLLARLHTATLDLVIVEGFKLAPIPKIEVHRPSMGHPLLAAGDPWIVAVATDEPARVEAGVPVLDLNRPAAVAQFICDRQWQRPTDERAADIGARDAWEDGRRRGASPA
jgi:molybdopterin-guanine dinucleotide biosynthesis adapter protein